MRRLTVVTLICTLLLALVPGPRAALAADNGALPPAGMLQLPFPIGETWTFNGVHGPRNEAIDFSVGRPWPRWRSDTSKLWVVAAAPGSIRKVSGCGVEIDHADGWTTVYYHIEQITRDSGEVQANEKIGIVANTQREAACEGGYATAPHLHFALKHNGQEVPLDGLVLSGWRVHSGRGHYDSNCKRMYLYRGDQKACPYVDPLTNQGIPADADQLTSPHPTAGQGASQGTAGASAQIELDTLDDGATVRGSVSVQGWAVDHAGLSGTGIDHVHLYLDGPAGQGTFLAEASYGLERADVADTLGDPRFRPAGYRYDWDASALAPGPHTLYIYAHSSVADWAFVSYSLVVEAP